MSLAITQPTWTTTEAIDAIRSRIQGVWDHPQLVKLGALSIDTENDLSRILAHVRPEEPSLAAAVSGLSEARLATLDPGVLGKALAVVEALAASPTLQGFDDEDAEVDGGDAVDVIGELWTAVRAVVPRKRASSGRRRA